MTYIIIYHDDVVSKDIPAIFGNMRVRVKKAIEERLMFDPLKFGEPLRRSLKGYRKLRVGDYRVVYLIRKNEIIIIKIGHRKEVYEKAFTRLC